MSGKDSPQSVIDAYRKRQQMTPVFVWGLVGLLVVVGIIILVVWFAVPGKSGGGLSLFASATPTATDTATPTPVTPTATATITPSATITPTATVTATATGPFEYTVQENDNCYELAAKNKVDVAVLLALNNFGNACPIKPGDKILIPVQGQQLPTDTPLPTNIAKGTKIEYIVKSGDSLASIALKFGSTVDAIKAENKLTDVNKINFGDKLIIPVNIITATPVKTPTRTPAASATKGTPAATSATKGATAAATTAATTSAATVTPTPTKKPA